MTQQFDQLFVTPKPFVKWAGGKRQIMTIIDQHMPSSFGTFFEPFLGGGAVLFHLLSKNPTQRCTVSDLNSDLILSYITIRDRLDDLVSSLKKHSRNYAKNPDKYYATIRSSEPKGQIEKTSRFIFLNRTCFNGLYRVNRDGKFNVPLGRYTNPNIVNEENLQAVHHALHSKKINISCRDFSSILDRAKKGDFVYFDPPYQPTSKTSSFTSYTSRNFTVDDLNRLYELCLSLDSKGCKIMLSNSDSPQVSKLFCSKPWNVTRIPTNRFINSNSKKRTGHVELLITNY